MSAISRDRKNLFVGVSPSRARRGRGWRWHTEPAGGRSQPAGLAGAGSPPRLNAAALTGPPRNAAARSATSQLCCCIAELAVQQDLIDDAILHRLLSGEDLVAVDVGRDLLLAPAGVWPASAPAGRASLHLGRLDLGPDLAVDASPPAAGGSAPASSAAPSAYPWCRRPGEPPRPSGLPQQMVGRRAHVLDRVVDGQHRGERITS